MGALGTDPAARGPAGWVGHWRASVRQRARGSAGASVSSPHARRLGAGVLLGASPGQVGLAWRLEVGSPLDHEAEGLAGEAGGFVLPPPRCTTPMIMASSRDLPAWTWRFGFGTPSRVILGRDHGRLVSCLRHV